MLNNGERERELSEQSELDRILLLILSRHCARFSDMHVHAYLAVNSDAVIVITPFLGLELYSDIKTQPRNETAPLFRVLNGKEWGSGGNDVHLLIVS